MSSLTFTSLQKAQVTNNKYLYTDLHLDLDNPVMRDLKTDNDEAAIRNSIINLFNTIPGQNLLNPNYGLNLIQFVFEPASTSVARKIGDTILQNLTVYEPRIQVDNIDVKVNAEEQMYTITLSIIIPQFNSTIVIPGTLSKNGYSLL
jgi:phage baseplate assembly protein W